MPYDGPAPSSAELLEKLCQCRAAERPQTLVHPPRPLTVPLADVIGVAAKARDTCLGQGREVSARAYGYAIEHLRLCLALTGTGHPRENALYRPMADQQLVLAGLFIDSATEFYLSNY